MKKILSALIIGSFILFVSCSREIQNEQQNPPQVKNIIFLIGDGMGVAQVYAAMTLSDSPLKMVEFPYTGLQKTNSLDDYKTDSAAGGTALASGNKTNNGVIGQDTLGNAFKSILHIAEENGLSTGLVSTSSITHATPAAFIAHEHSRKNYEAIAADFLDTDIDLFIGGGYDHFANRDDGLNLADSLKAKGYHVTTTIDEVAAIENGKLAGFTAPVHNPRYSEGRGDMLPVATEKAIDLLSKNDHGFFLMIEGSQIDWGGHANDIDYVVEEMLDFDRSVGIALDFAKKEGNTLVVVTSDHETGGLFLTGKHKAIASFGTSGHSAVMVPVFSYGPGAEMFTGVIDNTDFFEKFMILYGFQE